MPPAPRHYAPDTHARRPCYSRKGHQQGPVSPPRHTQPAPPRNAPLRRVDTPQSPTALSSLQEETLWLPSKPVPAPGQSRARLENAKRDPLPAPAALPAPPLATARIHGYAVAAGCSEALGGPD